ncbi:ABC transporter ATP-binding protein [Fusibacter sp. 3D3]|uniref:ABC transporter ATP-binding protein n=1 Tax=Fusibacter sp. 3D3 TaxID=1048380 RepID=UPI0008538B08|nr:ABC transporter ATP-binding protein [Fusibacter sp. 3D3]GAU78626.1 iron(III) dicitrate transport ATP-binding protein FecE [Fusibacter sp. 3D3]
MRIEVIEGSFFYHPEQLVLRNINFELKEQTIMTILGKNGVGKTTLLKCMIGLLKWKKGKTLIDSQVFTSLMDFDKVGYVPQAHNTVFAFTVEEMVTMGRARHVSLFGLPSKFDKDKVKEALDSIGISHLKHKLCSEISGGQLQLVYIARALVNDPKILILDEPESHLDFSNQHMVLNKIKEFRDQRGISCIINTHYPDNALNISDKTLILGNENYIFGDSQKVITEENMKDFFDVSVKIYPHHLPGKLIHSFAVVGE